MYLGSSSVGGEFRDDTNPADVITSVVIPDGSSTATFRYSDTAVGTPTITAADQVGPETGLTDASQLETVTPAAASQLDVSAPAAAVAGAPFDVTVTALDEFGNADTNNAGTVTFSSSDPAPTLPADTTLTAGTGTFSAVLTQVGSQTISAEDFADNSIAGTSDPISVTHGAAASVSLALSPDTVPADLATTSDATVTVTDQYGNLVPDELGITLSTSGDVTFGSVTDNHDGTYSATVTASATYGDEAITAHDGPLSSDPQTLHETALSQTVTFVNPGTHTYGDAPFASGATAGTRTSRSYSRAPRRLSAM